MIKLASVLVAIGLASGASARAWPFPPFSQCGPYPTCGDGCYVPPTPKCEAVADDMISNAEAIPCDDGSGPGVCAAQ